MKLVARKRLATLTDGDCNFQKFASSLPDIDDQNLRLVWKKIAAFDLFRLLQPNSDVDTSKSASELLKIMMSFGKGCRDNGLALGVNSHIWTIQQLISEFGSEEQKDTYLPSMMAGKTIGAFALTEENAGSDALSLETRAEQADSGYLLSGKKCFVGMGPICDIAIVFASTAPGKGRWGLSVFLVHANDRGFVRGHSTDKLGLNSTPMGHLSFEDCWVPTSRRIGPEGAGASIIQTVLDWERSFILASQVGAMSRQLAECVDFAAERQVFGQPISEYQSISNRLAEMRVRLETCKLMLERAAELYDRGEPLTQFAAMTNLHISEAFLASSLDAMRTFGGSGYLKGSRAGADLSDAAGGITYSGTSDIQRQIIAKLELAQRRQPFKTGGESNEV